MNISVTVEDVELGTSVTREFEVDNSSDAAEIVEQMLEYLFEVEDA